MNGRSWEDLSWDLPVPTRRGLGFRLTRRMVRMRHRLFGLDRYAHGATYFEPDGREHARETCEAANADFLGWIAPPDGVRARGATHDGRRTRAGGVVVDRWSFDSPLPGGVPENDRVRLRTWTPPDAPADAPVVLFHHPIYQRNWSTWEWFLEPIYRRTPVAVLAAPFHFERTPPGQFPGEGTVNANPACLFRSVRQWCRDHEAAVDLLRREVGREPRAEIGFSLGGFQLLALAAAGRVRCPIVTISATNRYAWGLTHGLIGTGLRRAIEEAGIDAATFRDWTRSLEMDRHVEPLQGHDLLYVYGTLDRVDPPPSLDRLREALQPRRVLELPAGHGTILFRRNRIGAEIRNFLKI